MTLIEVAPKPTKKYIASLMRSELLVPRQDHVEMCQSGWKDAQSDSDKIRRACVPGLLNAWETLGDVYALGYLTFVYAYTEAMK